MVQILSQLPQIILAIIALIFFLAVLRQVLYWTWFWQLKEYRTDRIGAHFQDVGIRNILVLLSGYSALRRYRRPKFTGKAILAAFISFCGVIAISLLIFQTYFSWFKIGDHMLKVSSLSLSLESIERFANFPVLKSAILILLEDYGLFAGTVIALFLFTPIIVFFSIILINFLAGFIKAVKIYRAKRKIKKFPNLKIIGITGSYGKSTTKEILAEILSKKFKVLKTPANVNTPIGISQLILDKLDDSYEVFVVEMGAYKIGEIKQICDIVSPQIGIITAINEQHLALFGSIENTVKAKFELIQSLPKDGLAILNVGDKNIQTGLEKEKCTIAGDGCTIKAKIKQYSVGAKADAYAINPAASSNCVKFKFISGADMMDFTLNIIGVHNISNALAAIVVARGLGMSLDEVFWAAQRIDRLVFTFKSLPGPNGSTLIDDTYNSNPDGVMAAINYIENQRGRKFVIMSPLIELGSSAHKIHYDLGKKLSSVAVKLIFLDNYYISDIKKGVAENEDSMLEVKVDRNIQRIAKSLEDEMKPSDIALFLNRRAGLVLELLKKN